MHLSWDLFWPVIVETAREEVVVLFGLGGDREFVVFEWQLMPEDG